ncbi:hypothetical protein B296_00043731 [Ensete ventricosum]|uniref:Uncharacterized protein n=1 Tax=Ensete ventricosum TaxID=4639 RepID=A0A426WXS8_ENSVE|nr:hypothetical protein B296_00043731 [Ensete ventricosum]
MCRHVVAHGEVVLAAPSSLVVVVDVVALPAASPKSSGGEPCTKLKMTVGDDLNRTSNHARTYIDCFRVERQASMPLGVHRSCKPASRHSLTVLEWVDGEVDDLGIIIRVSDGYRRVLAPETVESFPEQRVVQPRQGVVAPRASGLGAVVFGVGCVEVGQVQWETPHGQHSWHDDVRCTEADQSLRARTSWMIIDGDIKKRGIQRWLK